MGPSWQFTTKMQTSHWQNKEYCAHGCWVCWIVVYYVDVKNKKSKKSLDGKKSSAFYFGTGVDLLSHELFKRSKNRVNILTRFSFWNNLRKNESHENLRFLILIHLFRCHPQSEIYSWWVFISCQFQTWVAITITKYCNSVCNLLRGCFLKKSLLAFLCLASELGKLHNCGI